MKCFLLTFGAFIMVVCIRITLFSLPMSTVVKLEVENIYGEIWEGSGVFVQDDLILTAGHMVQDADAIWVIWPDNKRHQAISWYQEDSMLTDVGLVNIVTMEVEPEARFNDPKIGETVKTIGNSFGYGWVLSKGIVSAVDIEEWFFGEKHLLIIDAATNPGNSGGPVLNKKDEIIGINIGGISGSQGMSFCVPAKICQLVIDKYLAIEELNDCI